MATTKITQAIQQLEAAGADTSVFAYVHNDRAKFSALAALSGATVKTEWHGSGNSLRVHQTFERHIDGVRITVATSREPTAEDWQERVVSSVPAAKVLVGVFGGKS